MLPTAKKKRAGKPASIVYEYFEATGKKYKCLLLFGSNPNVAHQPLISGPSGNLITHMERHHSTIWSIALANHAAGKNKEKTAKKLISTSVTESEQKGIKRYMSRVAQLPGGAKKQALLVLWMVEKGIAFSSIDVNALLSPR